MALTTITQAPFRVTLKTELQTFLSQMTEGAMIFCDENSAWYVKKGGVIINFSGVSISTDSSVTTSTASSSDVVVTGMTVTPGKGNYKVSFNAQYSINSGNVTGQAAADYTNSYNNLISIAATNTTHLPAFGGGETLTAGVYTVASAGSIAGNLTLNAQGNSNAVFIFRFGAAFSTGAGATVILTNGASASNIYWVCEGAMSLGATTTIKGSLFAHNGAITLGASSNVQGRLFTNSGNIGIDGATITKPASSYISLGMLSTFVIFTSLGNLTNTGVSNITGDIGTNSGTISGFGTAIITGTTYLPGVDNNALATFSIYQNGTLIPNSVRTRTLNINTVDIILESNAIVDINQAIDVRYKIDSGTIFLYNRILTVSNIQ